jgi:hypothetical protein
VCRAVILDVNPDHRTAILSRKGLKGQLGLGWHIAIGVLVGILFDTCGRGRRRWRIARLGCFNQTLQGTIGTDLIHGQWIPCNWRRGIFSEPLHNGRFFVRVAFVIYHGFQHEFPCNGAEKRRIIGINSLHRSVALMPTRVLLVTIH